MLEYVSKCTDRADIFRVLDIKEKIRHNNTMNKIRLINGPNLNMLGMREPALYGTETLEQIHTSMVKKATALHLDLETFQSNAEHELIETLQAAPEDGINFIIINPAALTHTSIALRDALLAINLPFIEIHLSNPQAREPFRKASLIADIAIGTISGLGSYGYELALLAAKQHLSNLL
jgi:3-dehydroquinate dehydratase II